MNIEEKIAISIKTKILEGVADQKVEGEFSILDDTIVYSVRVMQEFKNDVLTKRTCILWHLETWNQDEIVNNYVDTQKIHKYLKT